MAYHLTGTKALIAMMEGKLTPLKADQGLVRTCEKVTEFEDARKRFVRLPVGMTYRITGTRNGDGYVITFDDTDRLNGTRYLTADVGCNLV